MTLKELYLALDANYEEALMKMNADELIKRGVFRFRDTNPYQEMMDAYGAHDVVRLYEATHSMKEILGELALSKLLETANNICEVSRNMNIFDEESLGSLVQSFEREYQQTIAFINELD